MRRRALILMALVAGMAGSLGTTLRAQDKPADVSALEGTRALHDFSKASQALYKKVSGSLVRVKMENGLGAVAGPQLLKEFEEWRQKQPGNAAGGGTNAPRRDLRGERHAKPEGDGPAATMPARPSGGGQAGFRKFLEQKLKDAPDAETQARLRAVLARFEAARPGPAGAAAEVTGVVIDDQGHALVAWGWVRENPGATFRVIGADGTELGAKYLGAHTGRGVALIKLESPGTALPAVLAQGRPAGGELLMCLSARHGSVGWATAPAPSANALAGGKKGALDRFALAGEERGATYLFNAKGELAALGNEKFAIPIEVVKADIQWIIDNGKDITPRRLGVKYAPLPPEMRKKLAALGDKAAVIVQEVAPGSAAEKAGLKKDDILLAIDDVSIALLPQIQVDLATRGGSVPVEIFRAGKQVTLEMPLGEK